VIKDFDKELDYPLVVISKHHKYKYLKKAKLHNGAVLKIQPLPAGTHITRMPSGYDKKRDKLKLRKGLESHPPEPIFGEGRFEIAGMVTSTRDDVFVDLKRHAERKKVSVKFGKTFYVRKGNQIARCKFVGSNQRLSYGVNFRVIQYTVK